MCRCEFCYSKFDHRPQVKNPRACLKPECQELRQRANEREWRERHPGYADTKYHQIRRGQRAKKIQDAVAIVMKCLRVGREVLGIDLAIDVFSDFVESFLFDLGVRQINKFWSLENVDDSASISGGVN